jgi:hypothetical protein
MARWKNQESKLALFNHTSHEAAKNKGRKLPDAI